jgi:hypothetical protein
MKLKTSPLDLRSDGISALYIAVQSQSKRHFECTKAIVQHLQSGDQDGNRRCCCTIDGNRTDSDGGDDEEQAAAEDKLVQLYLQSEDKASPPPGGGTRGAAEGGEVAGGMRRAGKLASGRILRVKKGVASAADVDDAVAVTMLSRLLNLPTRDCGSTVLHLAARNGDVDTVRLLCDAGARLDLCRNGAYGNGNTAVAEAISQGGVAHEAVCEIIVAEQERRGGASERSKLVAFMKATSGGGSSGGGSSGGGSSGGAGAQSPALISREILVAYMKQHNPDKAGAAQIDHILSVYDGRHAKLRSDLAEKYGAKLPVRGVQSSVRPPPPNQSYEMFQHEEAAAATTAASGQRGPVLCM